jgi:hypothetical protein
MCVAMDAISYRAVPEISGGSLARSDEGDASRKGLFVRRAAIRISWLLVLVLRNASASATPLELTHGAGRMAISRLVTEGDVSPPILPRTGSRLAIGPKPSNYSPRSYATNRMCRLSSDAVDGAERAVVKP